MSDALAIAASGLKSEEFLIDKIANDLANLNTANYKATTISFEDVLYQNINGATSLSDNQPTTQIGLGTAVYKSGKDFSIGPLKSSDKWSDVTINGAGFYQVMNHDNTIMYSRNSSLRMDDERYLCTQEGLRLADNIQIPDDVKEVVIKGTGEVEVSTNDDPEPQLLGTIQLAKFANPEGLNALGSGMYLPTEESGDPLTDNPGSNGLGELAQKQIEGSNVDMVGSLMQLTMAQRVYQLNAKAAQIADELERITNEIHA